MADALRGRHAGAPCSDMLKAFGKLRADLQGTLGEDALIQHGDGWFDALVHTHLDNLPIFTHRLTEKSHGGGKRRLRGKTPDASTK